MPLQPDRECLNPKHVYLRNTHFISPSVTKSLKDAGATRQDIDEKSIVPARYDELSIVVDKMPSGLTPEQYLDEMANDLNKAVNNHGKAPLLSFDSISEFVRRSSTPTPMIGNIYDIDMLGPDNGHVILVERTPSHFIFQTITMLIVGYIQRVE